MRINLPPPRWRAATPALAVVLGFVLGAGVSDFAFDPTGAVALTPLTGVTSTFVFRFGGVGTGGNVGARDGGAALGFFSIASRASMTALAVGGRSAGFLDSRRMTKSAKAGGSSGARSRIGRGASLVTARSR